MLSYGKRSRALTFENVCCKLRKTLSKERVNDDVTYVYDDVTYVYDDVTYVYDDVTYANAEQGA